MVLCNFQQDQMKSAQIYIRDAFITITRELKYKVTVENIKNKRSRGERFCSTDYVLNEEM